MATKAQQFKARQERSGKKKAPAVKRHKRAMDPKHTATRNLTKRSDKKSGMALEDSMSGTPSRKSTRKAVHGGRSDNPLMRTTRAKSLTPKARAQRAQAART